MATKMQIQTSKGLNDQSVVFGDLKPWKNTWLVHVKVLHAWKQYIQSVETMEFVLADDTCTGGKQRKKLEFTLSDINDSRLPYCIWGNLAEKLHSAINQEARMVTTLLRFAKLGRFRGELQISNAFDASQMIINPSIAEAEAFKELINDDDKTLTSFQSNEDSQEDNNKQGDQSEKRGQRDKWFWLHLMVSDDTGVSKIMILDKVANGIVAESPEKLLNGSWDEFLVRMWSLRNKHMMFVVKII
ncbi:hypothetical protein F2Q69_00003745 [Brassica cretica]|uniref:DUF223 domain-containing protein n=1 Tax=Brassica cretica TaxID=69181 RepID=A0A8S9NQL6_BRACR|nr:hypothetical protein F2Q69_00003745 [Brassica cretica]